MHRRSYDFDNATEWTGLCTNVSITVPFHVIGVVTHMFFSGSDLVMTVHKRQKEDNGGVTNQRER